MRVCCWLFNSVFLKKWFDIMGKMRMCLPRVSSEDQYHRHVGTVKMKLPVCLAYHKVSVKKTCCSFTGVMSLFPIILEWSKVHNLFETSLVKSQPHLTSQQR